MINCRIWPIAERIYFVFPSCSFHKMWQKRNPKIDLFIYKTRFYHNLKKKRKSILITYFEEAIKKCLGKVIKLLFCRYKRCSGTLRITCGNTVNWLKLSSKVFKEQSSLQNISSGNSVNRLWLAVNVCNKLHFVTHSGNTCNSLLNG